MTKLDRLKREARVAAAKRGHVLGSFRKDENHRGVRFALCRYIHCSCGVVVDSKPPPNGIDISGEAVALNCKKGGPKA